MEGNQELFDFIRIRINNSKIYDAGCEEDLLAHIETLSLKYKDNFNIHGCRDILNFDGEGGYGDRPVSYCNLAAVALIIASNGCCGISLKPLELIILELLAKL